MVLSRQLNRLDSRITLPLLCSAALGLCLCLLSAGVAAQQDKPGTAEAPVTKQQIDLLHWWISPGETRALQEIIKEAQNRALDVNAIGMKNHNAVRDRLVELLTVEQSPHVSQWFGGPDLHTLSHMLLGIHTQDADDSDIEKLSNSIHPAIRELVTVDGKLVAVPVVTHIQNTMFVNKRLLERHQLDIPDSWQQLLTASSRLEEQGSKGVLVSGEAWQLRMLFNNILLSTAGGHNYQRLYNGTLADSDLEIFEQAFDILFSIRKLQGENSKELYWADAIAELAHDRAAFVFLGDFARAELVQIAPDSLNDYACLAPPGDDGTVVYGTDIFVLFKDPHNQAISDSQKELAKVILDPQVQNRFVNYKGGIPVVSNVIPESLDNCAQSGWQRWSSDQSLKMQIPWSSNRARFLVIERMIKELWDEPGQTASSAAKTLMEKISE